MSTPTDSHDKVVMIIAGPNGAGKTTFARTFLAPLKDQIRFINADYIAAGLSPFNPEMAAIRAGKIMLEEVNTCFKKGESFAIETTLSGKSYIKHIARWRENGYFVYLIFLLLDDVNLAVERVAKRVSQGGHNIPEPVIKRRFKNGLELFNSHYKHAVSQWVLYDNSGIERILLEQGVNP